jgi:hypothetical protein
MSASELTGSSQSWDASPSRHRSAPISWPHSAHFGWLRFVLLDANQIGLPDGSDGLW